MIKIDHLYNHKEHIETVAKWLWNEWPEGNSYEMFLSIMEHSLDPNKIPQAFIAFDDGQPVGTVSLWRADMMSRQDLFPWLSALYIVPAYRKNGLGKLLQNHLQEHARSLGFEEIFLYTGLEGYYERSGWEYMTQGITSADTYDRIYKMNLR